MNPEMFIRVCSTYEFLTVFHRLELLALASSVDNPKRLNRERPYVLCVSPGGRFATVFSEEELNKGETVVSAQEFIHTANRQLPWRKRVSAKMFDLGEARRLAKVV